MTVTAKTEAVELGRSLERAIREAYHEQAVDILKRLHKIRASRDLLKSTSIGKTVNKLRRYSEHVGVSQNAHQVYLKWKADVGIGTENGETTPSPTEAENGVSEPAITISASATERITTGARGQTLKKRMIQSHSTPQQITKAAQQPTRTTAVPQSTGLARTTGKPTRVGAPTNGKPAPQSVRSNPTGASAPVATNGATPAERTVKTDSVRTPFLDGNKIRVSCWELLYKAIASNTTTSKDVVVTRTTEIEEALINQNRTTNDAYKAKIRSLSQNVRSTKNETLNNQIISGEIPATRLVNMSKEELAPEALKKEVQELNKQNMFAALAAPADAGRAATNQFRCGKCKGRNCSYYQMQTRSADEPMTTFVTCMDCNNNWKFS